MGTGRGARVAVDVELFSLGERQRRQLCLALADVSQFVGRPDIRARVTHRLADEVVDGGRRQRREEVAKETRVVCAPYKRWGLSATQRDPGRGPGPQRAAHSRVSCAQPSGRRSATPACSCPEIRTARCPPSRTSGRGR
eukprot:scaffold61442_cov86-Phaeocystis_antarctica.AAC.1